MISSGEEIVKRSNRKALLLTIVWKEIRFRTLNSLMIFICCAGLVAACTALFHIFAGYAKCEEIYAQSRQHELKASMDSLWTTYSKITKSLGFNVLILPRDQNLSDFYAQDFASKVMPETYARTLVDSKIVSVEHVAPSLYVKAVWPETRRSVIVCGTQGELTRGAAAPSRSAIIDPIPQGMAVAGYELARALNLKKNSRITFMGHPLTISACNQHRGSRDDITLWVNLKDTQAWFKKEGLINSILALECRCSADQDLPLLGKIRTDLENILPQTQVIEYMSEVLTRAEERYRAEQTGQEVLARELQERARLRENRMRMSAFCLLLFLAGSIASIGLLISANVRERRSEVGVLKALGVPTHTVLSIFLCKLALIGTLAGSLGYCSGWGAARLVQYRLFGSLFETGFNAPLFVAALLGSVVVTVGAGWLPALGASVKNTAGILQEAR